MDIYILCFCIFMIALLYSAVGQGGGSGYVAVLALFALSPEEIKSSALILNVFVSGIAFYKFFRAGSFCWRTFLPIAISSLPFAFLGGFIALPPFQYGLITGTALLVSAILLFRKSNQDDEEVSSPSLKTSFLLGSGIGFLSGTTGLGGGIFLSPLLLLGEWVRAKQAPGISAAFILVNSISALFGLSIRANALPNNLWMLLIAALIGGVIGARFGSRKAGSALIVNGLASILVFAGLKLFLDAFL